MAPEVGCSASYIGQWQLGQVPDEDLVRAFARATDSNEDELLRAAGYLPPYDADAAFMAGIRCAAAEKGDYILVSTEEMPIEHATEEEVARAVRAIRIREGLSPECACP
jgi:hypothetical protein